MAFTKKFKLRGNFPQINKLKTELTKLVNQGVDNSEEKFRLEEQIQLLVDDDLTKALQNRKNFRILEDERLSKSFLNLDTMKLCLLRKRILSLTQISQKVMII